VIGTNLTHYRVVGKLAGGGMGVVYSAVDVRLDRPVALKLLPETLARDAAALVRFKLEAKAASAINHPNICTIHEIDEHEGRTFLVMELLQGKTLKQLIEGQPLENQMLIELAEGFSEGLAALHRERIVHCDVKPANLFVTERGVPKLLDFGLAKLQPSPDDPTTLKPGSERSEAQTMGTLNYMSPEQVRGERLDARSDVFSWGAVLYEMATGRQAFAAGTTSAVLDAIIGRTPTAVEHINPQLPPALGAVIAKALEKKPRARYQDASEMLADLARIRRAVEQGMTRAFETRPAVETNGQRSLAILPFENMSADPDCEYICDGIPEGLINTLSSLSGLKVMARSTTFRYKGKTPDPQTVGRELGVDCVLVGRVTQRAGALVIASELLDVAKGWQIWGQKFDRRLDDLLAIEEEIVREISSNLRVKLSLDQDRRLQRRRAQNPTAHQAYLSGRFQWNKWTPEGFQSAMDHYQKAIAADPEGPLGYAGLADAWSLLGLYALDPPKEAFPLAKEAALKALQLDPELAEAHSALGTVRFFHEWDWPAASSDFERAIALNPGYASCYHIFSSAYSALGRHDEALEKAKASLELDPFSLVALLNMGWLHFYARRYDEAIAECRRALALDPKFLRAHELLGMALAGKRKFSEALQAARHVMTEHDGGPRGLAVCGYIFAVSGSRDEARDTVDTLRELAEHRYVPALSIAFVSGALGKLDTAFGWLQRAYDEQDSLLVWLRVDPRLDNLRSDPRFRELEEQVGLRLWGRSAGLR